MSPDGDREQCLQVLFSCRSLSVVLYIMFKCLGSDDKFLNPFSETARSQSILKAKAVTSVFGAAAVLDASFWAVVTVLTRLDCCTERARGRQMHYAEPMIGTSLRFCFDPCMRNLIHVLRCQGALFDLRLGQ